MSELNDVSSASQDVQDQNNLNELLKEPSHIYVEKSIQLEDVTSTAYSFTIVGTVGFVFLFAVWIDILPIAFAFYMKCMLTAVLGSLFGFFIYTGIKSFQQRKALSLAKSKEEDSVIEIEQWFKVHYSSDAISSGLEDNEVPVEQLYFLRSENITRIVQEQFPDLEETFLEHMTEKIYQMYFPD